MSASILVSYVLLGLTLAAPIGPVNSARLDKGLKNGFGHAWIVGVGSMIADAFFMLMVYLGLVQFLGIPFVQIFLWLFGGFILIYSGVKSILGVNSITLTYNRKKESLFKCFLTGFVMSITSPLSILFWLGIYGSILAKTAQDNGTGQLLIYSSMIFIGLTLWDIFVAALTTVFRKYLNSIVLIAIVTLSGLSLIGFGLYFGYQGITSLFLVRRSIYTGNKELAKITRTVPVCRPRRVPVKGVYFCLSFTPAFNSSWIFSLMFLRTLSQ